MSLTKIASVDPHSPARKAGVRPGETLTHINGHPIVDVLDYKFYAYDPKLELTLTEPEGGSRTLRIRKEEGEDLGLNFETYLMDRARSCANKCIFCFVDQMPPGMRDTLYFKDDDARLSFLMGNYITLTNLSQREIQRVIDLRISPINISVHATDPQLRTAMLKNPRAGECLDIMSWFAQAGIEMNCQVVACPGVNDGPALARTMEDLGQLYPAVTSVAVVPVGVTRFREGLCSIEPYTKEQAAALIDQVESFASHFMENKGTNLVWCSDEFYLIAGRTLPEKAYYEDMDQLENGVGMLRLLLHQADMALEEEEPEQTAPFSIATGLSAAPFVQEILDNARKQCGNIKGTVYPIINRFFGETITVSGLITGTDLMEQLRGKDLGERLLIPDNMLRAGERVFLDDVTVEQVEEALGVTVVPVPADSGFDLADAILGREVTAQCPVLPPEAEYYRYNPSS
ncbi:DUF512 domain-containing protein [uncultured Flavonifractor sp.]|uniref:DUF512 domain-containing protein n=1 Tax=Candidatus Flavonifractor intestinigallinarum TaxID=2838586 RepID=A0A9D2MJU0_9FIRM|nr:DUF512 domain-containing protein [uncultured Flavonifractor sp.]HJB79676.1 DUF512 domain-containing protein [Candidatus Flavonifractor intestinigallinarum]